MLPLIISIISIFLVAGVATVVYIQSSKQRDLYNKKLLEVVTKTNNANQYEYEKNKDQEVALEKVRADIVRLDTDLSALKKQFENMKAQLKF